ncbi:MAG: hypothetical protein AB1679_23215 [Actinomycetota bacterium]
MGGLLLTPPRTSESPAPGSTTTAPGPGQATTTRTGPDLSPRADRAGKGDGDGAAGPSSPEEVQVALPDQLALGDILPPPEALPANPPPADTTPTTTGEAAPDPGPAGQGRWPLTAGLLVTLLVLFFGGGFLWWRNRDSQYWPA